MTWAQISHPDDLAADAAFFRRTLAGEIDSYSLDKRWIRKDGVVVDSVVLVSCVRRADGSAEYFLWLLLDMTARKRGQEALQKAQADLAHAARVMTMGELTAYIAHEINQPLTAVITNAQACARLLTDAAPELDEARAAAMDIVEAGTRAGAVIARMRALLRKETPIETRLDLNTAIHDVLGLTRGDLRAHQISVQADLFVGLPPILGDRVQLQQVLLNLIMNGIEAMAAVTDRPRVIRLRSQTHESDKVLVAVQDSGVGLEPRHLERIYTIFITTKPGAMGMGLAVSRSIIEAYGGRLWAAASPGPGAAFYFTLPVCREEKA
jgi:C4-dicarboxylate-specific signal transduction histidine kinase